MDPGGYTPSVILLSMGFSSLLKISPTLKSPFSNNVGSKEGLETNVSISPVEGLRAITAPRLPFKAGMQLFEGRYLMRAEWSFLQPGG